MASAIEQIRAILLNNPDVEKDTLRDVIKICAKTKRTSAIQKDMRDMVKKYDKMNLTRLRKELKNAYLDAHKDDEESTPPPETAYRKFVKEQTAIMKSAEGGMWKDVPQAVRLVEIGKRWKAQKQQADLVIAASVELPSDDTSESKEPVIVKRSSGRGKKREPSAGPSTKPKRTRK